MKKTLLVVGIILLVLQAIAIFGGIVGGTFFSSFSGVFIADIMFLIGYNLMGIIGVILLVVYRVKND